MLFVVLPGINKDLILLGMDNIRAFQMVFDAATLTISFGSGVTKVVLRLRPIQVPPRRVLPALIQPPEFPLESQMTSDRATCGLEKVDECYMATQVLEGANVQLREPWPNYWMVYAREPIIIKPFHHAVIPVYTTQDVPLGSYEIVHNRATIRVDSNHIWGMPNTIITAPSLSTGIQIANYDGRQLSLKAHYPLGSLAPVLSIQSYLGKILPRSPSKDKSNSHLGPFLLSIRAPVKPLPTYLTVEPRKLNYSAFHQDVLNIININTRLTKAEHQAVQNLLREYAKAFAYEGNELGDTKGTFRINVYDITPISEAPQCLSPAKRKFVWTEIK